MFELELRRWTAAIRALRVQTRVALETHERDTCAGAAEEAPEHRREAGRGTAIRRSRCAARGWKIAHLTQT